ncbi:transporter substrate-binding domain-containing protein [Clostridium sp. SHJSY1]|uniref:substrate-binding periplasmic protein n=1 Tax=Clostridium sp. SHJSY1 TaxID=2942483 RepID=UPI00287481A1|nr:transporter substrate-binding domain-containing protein [Clostridium sp. SHJSY1]MDS0526738.1 transporter substrate-binding domain-containing protein [Clostridium sp. SHJSY1]
MKKYFKFLISILIISNFIGDITCSTRELENEDKRQIQTVDRLEKIKKTGILKVLSSDEEPFSYKDPKSNEFKGIDAEIINELANRLGIKKLEVRYVAFPNILEELIKDPEVDLLAQAIYITDERKKIINFTNPIYKEQDAILIREDSGINSKEDLKNKIISIVGGTVYENVAKEWKRQGVIKDYRPFFDFKSAQYSLENKIVDALLTDSMMAKNIVKTNPKQKLKLLSKSQYTPQLNLNVAVALKKEDVSLLDAINEKLDEMNKDGTIYGILYKHGFIENYIS